MTIDPIPDDESPPDAEPPFVAVYVASAQKHLEQMRKAVATLRGMPSDAGALEVLHRGFHSLHGNSSFIPDCPLTPLARAGEEALKAARKGRLDPQVVLEPVASVLNRCAARIEEYRLQGVAGKSTQREAELTTELLALARGISRAS